MMANRGCGWMNSGRLPKPDVKTPQAGTSLPAAPSSSASAASRPIITNNTERTWPGYRQAKNKPRKKRQDAIHINRHAATNKYSASNPNPAHRAARSVGAQRSYQISTMDCQLGNCDTLPE